MLYAHVHAARRARVGGAPSGIWPLADVPSDRLEFITELLRGGHPDVPVGLLVGFYSVEAREELERLGHVVVTCDYRHTEAPGLTSSATCA